MLERILPGASQLQNYHPLLVHFPIAFIYGASLLYFLAWISASERLQWTAFWMLVLGAVSAAIALTSGFYAAPGLMVSQSVRARYLFLAGLLAVVLLIAAGADLGGEMVYGYNAGGSACPQPIDLRK